MTTKKTKLPDAPDVRLVDPLATDNDVELISSAGKPMRVSAAAPLDVDAVTPQMVVDETERLAVVAHNDAVTAMNKSNSNEKAPAESPVTKETINKDTLPPKATTAKPVTKADSADGAVVVADISKDLIVDKPGVTNNAMLVEPKDDTHTDAPRVPYVADKKDDK